MAKKKKRTRRPKVDRPEFYGEWKPPSLLVFYGDGDDCPICRMFAGMPGIHHEQLLAGDHEKAKGPALATPDPSRSTPVLEPPEDLR